jgi:hypothetical protein
MFNPVKGIGCISPRRKLGAVWLALRTVSSDLLGTTPHNIQLPASQQSPLEKRTWLREHGLSWCLSLSFTFDMHLEAPRRSRQIFYSFSKGQTSPDSSVGIATGYGLGVPDRLWGPPRPLSNGHRGLLPGGKVTGGVEPTNHLHLMPRSRMLLMRDPIQSASRASPYFTSRAYHLIFLHRLALHRMI